MATLEKKPPYRYYLIIPSYTPKKYTFFPHQNTPPIHQPKPLELGGIDIKNEEKENSFTQHIIPSLFQKFWELYPRKANKGKALTSWNKLCTKPPKERPGWLEIKKALYYQKKSEQWGNPQFIPNPSTWLNQNRWLDDPAQMKLYHREENKPPIYDDGIKYIWDSVDKVYKHSVSGNIYIP
jgi:hypothetical protein